MSWGWIIFVIVLLIAFAAGGEAWMKRNRTRRLSDIQPGNRRAPSRPELGTEATDKGLVDAAHRGNEEIERRNSQRGGPDRKISAVIDAVKRTGDKK